MSLLLALRSLSTIPTDGTFSLKRTTAAMVDAKAAECLSLNGFPADRSNPKKM